MPETNPRGLLIRGVLHDVPGITVMPPASHGGPGRCTLSPEDYRPRPGSWISKITPHTTGGLPSQAVRDGAGPGGRALEIFDMWNGRDRGGGERVYSAAHVVVDFDGTVYCGADLATVMAYHATSINPTSIGIEMCTRADGSTYAATLDATALLIAALTLSGRLGSGLFPVPFQYHRGPYRNEPLRRLEVDGRGLPGDDVCGVIGHREQTSRRGVGDPGDEIYRRLNALGAEPLDYDASEDLSVGRARQAILNARGERLTVDGVLGPASAAALARQGFARWADVSAVS